MKIPNCPICQSSHQVYQAAAVRGRARYVHKELGPPMPEMQLIGTLKPEREYSTTLRCVGCTKKRRDVLIDQFGHLAIDTDWIWGWRAKGHGMWLRTTEEATEVD